MSENRQTVVADNNELTMTRIFDAPREQVFDAYSSSEHLSHWWGPRSWPMVECEIDFREGGQWHFCMRGPEEGDESWGLAIYSEIRRPEKIVYNDYFSDKSAAINKEMPGFHITITFEQDGDATRVVTHSVVGSKEELDKLMEMGMIEGFTETWDRLDEYLATAP